MTSNTTELLPNNGAVSQKRILDAKEYQDLCDFINNKCDLAIDCEIKLRKKFPQFERLTLKAILETVLLNHMRHKHWMYEANIQTYLENYEKLAKENPRDTTILLNIAKAQKIGPAMLCRTLLRFKYSTSKTELSKLLRYPHLIEDPLLSANVTQCLCSDSQDGPLIELKRRILGEEYEVKLKRMANEAGMHFYDENDLRRLGYDKTPDIKMILPFLYKGEVINWIESKAKFGDVKTHKLNIKQQLNSYCNRFGAGIIIYWFGYEVDTCSLPDNSIGITVLDDFPSQNDIELLDLSANPKTVDTKVTHKT